MPQSGLDARKRLVQAALELFAENGFYRITAAQIAARAGVTERTFSRHFPDKREVLFKGQNVLGAALSAAIERTPAEIPPFEALRRAFGSVAVILEQNRRFSEPRQYIISATPALQEREVAKHAAIARAVSLALQKRGVDTRRADLAAQTGLAVLSFAADAWFGDPSLRLSTYLDRGFWRVSGRWSRARAR